MNKEHKGKDEKITQEIPSSDSQEIILPDSPNTSLLRRRINKENFTNSSLRNGDINESRESEIEEIESSHLKTLMKKKRKKRSGGKRKRENDSEPTKKEEEKEKETEKKPKKRRKSVSFSLGDNRIHNYEQNDFHFSDFWDSPDYDNNDVDTPPFENFENGEEILKVRKRRKKGVKKGGKKELKKRKKRSGKRASKKGGDFCEFLIF